MDVGRQFKDAWGLFTKGLGPLMVGVLNAFLAPALAIGLSLVADLGESRRLAHRAG